MAMKILLNLSLKLELTILNKSIWEELIIRKLHR